MYSYILKPRLLGRFGRAELVGFFYSGLYVWLVKAPDLEGVVHAARDDRRAFKVDILHRGVAFI